MAGATAKPITIVGAGIAGLTAALCLKKHSIPFRIIEKNPEITTAGAGIQITPNAFRVLDALDIGERIKASAHAVNHLSVLEGRSSKLITRMPLGEHFERTHKAPYLVLKRQALLDTLHKQAIAQNIYIQFNTPHAHDNNSEDGIVIGADGVWSSVRQQMNGVEASFSGRSAFRCMIPKENAPAWATNNDLTMWLGPNAHFVAYPVDKAGTLNLVCVVKSQQPEKHGSSPATPSEISHHLEGWNQQIESLVALGRNWQRWPLYTVAPTQPWSHNNMVLLGDAAHAMVPFLAQGAAMAIEDAAALVDVIAKTSDTKIAFSHYHSLRQERVTRVWKEAKANGERYHWSGIKAKARNLGLKAMGGEQLQRRYNWIYKWQPPLF